MYGAPVCLQRTYVFLFVIGNSMDVSIFTSTIQSFFQLLPSIRLAWTQKMY